MFFEATALDASPEGESIDEEQQLNLTDAWYVDHEDNVKLERLARWYVQSTVHGYRTDECTEDQNKNLNRTEEKVFRMNGTEKTYRMWRKVWPSRVWCPRENNLEEASGSNDSIVCTIRDLSKHERSLVVDDLVEKLRLNVRWIHSDGSFFPDRWFLEHISFSVGPEYCKLSRPMNRHLRPRNHCFVLDGMQIISFHCIFKTVLLLNRSRIR